MERKFIIQKALGDSDQTLGWDILEVIGEGDTASTEWCERFELKRWAKEALANYLAGRPMMPN
jgi:hypothetical protein